RRCRQEPRAAPDRRHLSARTDLPPARHSGRDRLAGAQVVAYTTTKMPGSVDVTPFGFPPTESQVYGALLRLGPSTGYAVAHATRTARANTYGALEGLAGRAAPAPATAPATP